MMRRVLCATVVAAAALTSGCVDFALQDVVGVWGARHVELRASHTGAALRLDCADGAIPEPLLFNERFEFSVVGTHTEHARDPFVASRSHRARYDGRLLAGGRLEITVTLVDSVATVGRYELQRDRPGMLFPCK